MEVQEQRQREEESQREQGNRTREVMENRPLVSVEIEDQNVLTLTGSDGNSIINVSLTSSSQPGARTSSQRMTASQQH